MSALTEITAPARGARDGPSIARAVHEPLGAHSSAGFPKNPNACIDRHKLAASVEANTVHWLDITSVCELV